MDQQSPPVRGSEQAHPALTTLILITCLSLASLNMFLPSLPAMAEEFNVGYDTISLTIGGYLIFTAALQLTFGPLSDRIGRRPVVLAALAAFTAASFVCALAGDFFTFLIARIAQSAVISGMVLSRAILRDVYSGREMAAKMSAVTMAMGLAPLLAPIMGGLLDDFFGWRSVFLTYTGLGLAMLIWCWCDLKETNSHRSVSLFAQFRTYPEILAARPFWAYTACTVLASAAFYSFLAGIPIIAKTHLSISTSILGLGIGTISLGFVIGSFASKRYALSAGSNASMKAGRWIAVFGAGLGIVLLMLGPPTALTIFGATFFVGIGNGLTIPNSMTASMSIAPKLAGSASGLSGSLTVLGGAITAWIASVACDTEHGIYVLFLMLLTLSLMSWVSMRFAQRTVKPA